MSDKEICYVCRQEIVYDPEKIFTFPCFPTHRIHYICYVEQLKNKNDKCGICRDASDIFNKSNKTKEEEKKLQEAEMKLQEEELEKKRLEREEKMKKYELMNNKERYQDVYEAPNGKITLKYEKDSHQITWQREVDGKKGTLYREYLPSYMELENCFIIEDILDEKLFLPILFLKSNGHNNIFIVHWIYNNKWQKIRIAPNSVDKDNDKYIEQIFMYSYDVLLVKYKNLIALAKDRKSFIVECQCYVKNYPSKGPDGEDFMSLLKSSGKTQQIEITQGENNWLKADVI